MNTTNSSNFGLISMGAVAILLTACASQPTYNANHRPSITNNAQGVPSHYLVQQGDTVSKIASRYNLNWRDVSALNRLDGNNTIYTGQWLTLHRDKAVKQTTAKANKKQPTLTVKQTTRPVGVVAPVTTNNTIPAPLSRQALVAQNAKNTTRNTVATVQTSQPRQTATSTASQNVSTSVMTSSSGFVLPVGRQNKAVRNFGEVRQIGSDTFKTEGVWFSGKEGDAIVASRAGTVVYADSNQLPDASIAIRHTDGFVTEYRFIKDATIKQGQNVSAGQRIASMRANNGAVVTEFRVSKNSVYIDPLSVTR